MVTSVPRYAQGGNAVQRATGIFSLPIRPLLWDSRVGSFLIADHRSRYGGPMMGSEVLGGDSNPADVQNGVGEGAEERWVSTPSNGEYCSVTTTGLRTGPRS